MINVVADRGYFQIEDIEACRRPLHPHVPRPQHGSSVREDFFRRTSSLGCGRDAYVCPAGIS